MHWPTNLPRVCCHQIHRMCIWHSRTSAMSSEQQPNILSHTAFEIITHRVEMLCARTSTGHFRSRLKGNDFNGAATVLLLRLDKTRRDRWSEAVQTIDFSHYSRKAWSILNNLTDRSRRSPRHCAVSANAIAFQLIRNGRYEGIHPESSRLISKEVSDLWRATPTNPVNISESFTSQRVRCCPQTSKTRKISRPRFYFPIANNSCWSCTEVLVVWLIFLFLHHLKIPKV